MNFPSIDIQGSIISSDLLGKIRSEQTNFQQGKDFNKDLSNAKLKDEISSVWQDAKGQWTIFQNKLSRINEDEPGTTETRNFWILPLLTNLGYNLNFNRQAEEFNGKTFNIHYRDSQIVGFPVFIAGFNESLDRRPENKQIRVSPHAMVQEYLNYSEHLYGLVTNGKQLRLLRDASRITRLSYVEFNLQKMMEEDLYSDFVLFYRLLHSSRMPDKVDGGAESIIEKYHQEGLSAGSTIRSKLGAAVKDTIRTLANGFINHPDNAILREALKEGKLNAEDYYHHQLRIIYRLLFLFVIEERNLVYSESRTPETKRFSQIYFRSYSLMRLRKLAHKLPPPDANHNWDLWQGLLSTFAIFEKKEVGERLGIMSLQGDLFSESAFRNSVYDLHDCKLSNSILLRVLKALGFFENENGVLSSVNYGGLDVEEFGSVYEGLLELKLKFNQVPGSEDWICDFAPSEGRRDSGSHYTPEELVQPLIKHSLEYLIEDRIKPYKEKKSTKDATIESLLSLKICDVACGSGHILLSAARKLALEIAKLQTDEDQPNPMAIRKAIKQVVRRCIYGVDKNPLAVELCKVALWLETHNPGEPLNFLDHHIKCGDAIVGLAHRDELEKGIPDEAFKTLPGDNKDVAKTFRDQNIKDRKARLVKEEQRKTEFNKSTENSVNEAMIEYNSFNLMPESTPDEISKKELAYKKFLNGQGRNFLKAMADLQLAQFFIPKTIENREKLLTDSFYRQMLGGWLSWKDKTFYKADVISLENRFFHWFIEFPEVFNEEGFDCILGNPPYLNGTRISSNYGDSYLTYLKTNYSNTGGRCDYVGYFVRRNFEIIKNFGWLSLITNDTIAQNETREGTLDYIIQNQGNISFAIKSMRWPGKATTNIAIFAIKKGFLGSQAYIGTRKVIRINSFLTDEPEIELPKTLFRNLNRSFEGSKPDGMGFILDKVKGELLGKLYPEVIFDYLVGDDLNDSFLQDSSRKIINFFDWTLEKAINYGEAFEIVQNKVKPYRDTVKDRSSREKWWQFARPRPNLYQAIENLKCVTVISSVTKHINFVVKENKYTFSSRLCVINSNSFSFFSQLQSSVHFVWITKFATTMDTRLIYNNTNVFENFPFLLNLTEIFEKSLSTIGEKYHEYRSHVMKNIQLGLTKVYNAFHSREILGINFNLKGLRNLDKKSIEKQFSKEIWNLWNHLQKTPGTCSIEEAVEGIVKLRQLHVEMDNAVLEAYGWQDVQLRHDFYEVDYLPENDRVRYTIHPEARKEILKRLLELNHKIHEEEVAAGLWDKKKPKKYKTKASKSSKAEEPEAGYGGLF